MTPTDIIRLQPKAWAILSRSFKADRIAGTYLFYGRDGLGHWALSIALAALLNCAKPVRSDETDGMLVPCGKCRHCRTVYSLGFEGLLFAAPLPPHKNNNEAIDLLTKILDVKREEPFRMLSSTASTSIPIAAAREIGRKLALKAPEGITRLVLFYRMDKMLFASADALLKLIEEPPGDTVIVLTTERPDTLLPTIQSRAQKIRLERIPDNVIEQYLMEKHNISENRARLLTRLSGGSLGRALSMIEFDQDEDSSRRAVGFLLFKSMFLETGSDIIAHMTDLVNLKDQGEVAELLRLWQSLIRDCARFAIVGDDDELTNIDFASELKKLSAAFSNPKLAPDMVASIKNTLADLRRNVHIPGALTALALKLKSSIGAAS
ncbi:MAG: hypothetical protein U9R56_05535 [candidate division Zixibacteria bacterium]|nr:hypothetical protein [candidate division Zixibacteria bacterium]